MMKFKVGPSVRAATIPTGTGFGAFGGVMRHCGKFQKVKGGVLRCVSYKDGPGYPVCPTAKSGGALVDGGRSPGLVRPQGPCKEARAGAKPKARKAAAKKPAAKKAPRKPKK